MATPTPPVHRVPAFRDNYIWLFEHEPGRVAIVDPGDARPVSEALAALSLVPTHILNTHWHPDHVSGNLVLKEQYGLTVIGPADEADRIPGIDHAVAHGDRVEVGPHEAQVIGVGAHTAGHVAFHFAEGGILFPGDTLFAMGCGRLFEGTPADMHRALGRLAALPDETRVYCAHEYTLLNARFALTVEPDNAALRARYEAVQASRARGEATVPFTIADERATNPFVRAASVEELADYRRAKDVF